MSLFSALNSATRSMDILNDYEIRIEIEDTPGTSPVNVALRPGERVRDVVALLERGSLLQGVEGNHAIETALNRWMGDPFTRVVGECVANCISGEWSSGDVIERMKRFVGEMQEGVRESLPEEIRGCFFCRFAKKG